jgi:hypothetical protein
MKTDELSELIELSLDFKHHLDKCEPFGIVEYRDDRCLEEFRHIEYRQQLEEWKNYKGFKIQIYTDHLIDNCRHFHLEKKSENIKVKFDFDGNILQNIGYKHIEPQILKYINWFITPEIKDKMDKIWDKLNHS